MKPCNKLEQKLKEHLKQHSCFGNIYTVDSGTVYSKNKQETPWPFRWRTDSVHSLEQAVKKYNFNYKLKIVDNSIFFKDILFIENNINKYCEDSCISLTQFIISDWTVYYSNMFSNILHLYFKNKQDLTMIKLLLNSKQNLEVEIKTL